MIPKDRLVRIKERQFIDIINREYARAKKLLPNRYKGINRSFIKFYWDTRAKTTGGHCATYIKRISFNKNYRDCWNQSHKWSLDMFVLTLRHEIAHLVEPNHRSGFLKTLEILQGHRFVGHEVFIRDNKKKK